MTIRPDISPIDVSLNIHAWRGIRIYENGTIAMHTVLYSAHRISQTSSHRIENIPMLSFLVVTEHI